MEWKNYERKIICGYGYKLIGWPTEVPLTNGIDNLSEPVLRDIMSQLHSDAIYWKAATKAEVAQLKKSLPALPQRPDKGVKQKRYNLRCARVVDGKTKTLSLWEVIDLHK